MSKVFNWQTAYGRPDRVSFLRKNYNKMISVNDFVRGMKVFGTGKC